MFCLHLLFILGPHDRVLCSGTDKKVFSDSLVPKEQLFPLMAI